MDVRRGLPTFTLVGLPDRAIRESRERVRAALLNSGLEFPQKRLTVNLAPAHVRKAGPSFDLAIAVGPARRQLPGAARAAGGLRARRGALAERRAAPRARHAHGRARRPAGGLPAPARSGRERARGGAGGGDRGERDPDPGAARRPDARALVTRAGASGRRRSGRGGARRRPGPGRRARAGGRQARARDRRRRRPQPADDRPAGGGQDHARAAAAGNPAAAQLRGGARDHPGPQRGRHRKRAARHRAPVPRAAPHDLCLRGSWAAAARPMPGEITLAHRGVLFLDELPEFARVAVDALRQPLEEGRVEIMRGQRTLEFPANAIVVGGLQPLPVRAAARQLQLHVGGAGPLPAAPERPAGRPDRPRLPGRARADRGARGRPPGSAGRARPTCARGWWPPGCASSHASRAPACSATATWTGASRAGRCRSRRAWRGACSRSATASR